MAMSNESKQIARQLVLEHCTFVTGDGKVLGDGAELIEAVAKALDESWKQGFADCEMELRLQGMGLAGGAK